MRAPRAIKAPTASTEPAIPNSTIGKGAPESASAAPPIMTVTKANGTSQIARLPSCAAQTPTPSMASMWSSPIRGWRKPAMKPWPCAPIPVWAQAGAVIATPAIALSATIRASLFMVIASLSLSRSSAA
jgi:hypothetical protein